MLTLRWPCWVAVVSVPNKSRLCAACYMACLCTRTTLNLLLLEFMNGMEIVWMMITRKCLRRAAHNKLPDFSVLLWQINFTCCLKSLLNQQTTHVLVFLMQQTEIYSNVYKYKRSQRNSCLIAGILRFIAEDLGTVRLKISLVFILCKYWDEMVYFVKWYKH
jgi:hypothetical protein